MNGWAPPPDPRYWARRNRRLAAALAVVGLIGGMIALAAVMAVAALILA